MTIKFGNNIKKHFPIFSKHKNLIYLDNAATTHKPYSVIKAIDKFYSTYNANIHRGIYNLSEQSTLLYEQARQSIANYINSLNEEIIFTSGTTDSINLLINSLKNSRLIKSKNIKILLTELEHHSNILAFRKYFPKAEIIYIPIDNNFNLDISNLPDEVDIVSIVHISNVTGTNTQPQTIFSKYPNAIKILDSAQSVAHLPMDTKKLNADFIAFSAHKMYGPTGIGVLYGKKSLLKKIIPIKVGGGNIQLVTKEEIIYKDIPEKHEAGTPPIAQAVGFSEAIKFLTNLNVSNIRQYEKNLTEYTTTKLQEIPEIKIIHNKKSTSPVISIAIKGIHPHDISQFLADNNIATRSGHHCAQILHNKLNLKDGTTRISLGLYNDKQDIDILIDKLKELIHFFR